ncbi:class II histocompatibility antigen, B-L beta chain-like isoform X2 [Amblyraja radiata]|uniref:class II histocompatibility antigen, B-L beta chain-like isoform X2 n=1 Tax=Amblyraja radiata TaxID=386614 RepID=UPI0014029863|nr:class II histocompatibility antigen, B-L beta chain-like isoform X2 [Amblyraja radiata]
MRGNGRRWRWLLLLGFFLLDAAALGMHVGQVSISCAGEDFSLALLRFAFDGEEYIRFEYSLNKFVAKHPLAEPYADELNKNERVISNVARYVRRWPLISKIVKGGIRAETAKPAITITSRRPNAQGHPLVLTCRVDGFYPMDINTTWLRNGKDIDQEVLRSNILPNFDGTFQMRLQLSVDPSGIGDTYSCQITHTSVPDNLTAVWDPQNQNLSVYGYVVGIMAGLIGILIVLSAGVMRWKVNQSQDSQLGPNQSQPMTSSDMSSDVSAEREDIQLCEDVTSLPSPVSANMSEV